MLPGPSAAITALVASGLPTDVWRFAGFLPRKRGPLREVFAAPETVVAFESPRRVGASLKILAELDPERPAAVCRELTKLHEEIVRGSGAGARGEVRAAKTRAARSCSSSAARPSRDRPRPEGGRGGAQLLVDAGARAKTAAKVVSELTGAPSNELYRALLT